MEREWWKCTTVTDGLEINQTALTLVKGDRRAQRTVHDVSKLAANELQGRRTNQRMAKRERSTNFEGNPTSMSDVVRKASLGRWACTPGQVEDCRAMNAENGIPWQVEIPKRSAMDQGMEQ